MVVQDYKENKINNSYYIFYDFETTGLDPHSCQPASLGAIAINPRTLTWDKNDMFYSLMRPEFDDEKCLQLGLQPVQAKALEVNKLTREELSEAPLPSIVWEKFTTFVSRYKNGSSPFSRPIPCGFNIRHYDSIIVDRLCSKPPYKFGPVDKNGKPALFNTRDEIDMQRFLTLIVENFPDFSSQSMDTYRAFFGFPKHGRSHNSLVDAIEGAALMCKFLNHFRKIYAPSKLQNSMASFNLEEFL